MTTYVYPSRDDPMGWIRLIWPALELQSDHVNVMMPQRADRILYDIDPQGRIEPQIPSDATTMVVQRVTDRALVDIMRKWRDAGLHVVMDIDDDLKYLDPGANVNAWKLLHTGSSDVSWQNTEDAAKIASLVTCSTTRLVERYGNGHGMLIRNAVPANYLNYRTLKPTNIIGWTGAVGFRANDPHMLGGSLARLQRDGYPIWILGTDVMTAKSAFILEWPPYAKPSVQLFDYHLFVENFSVGLAPLKPSNFNLSKSWLKPLQYAALGVPAVMSPAPDYMALHEMGVGVIAQGYSDWYTQIRKILKNPTYAADLIKRGEEVAATQTYGARVAEWRYAWNL